MHQLITLPCEHIGCSAWCWILASVLDYITFPNKIHLDQDRGIFFSEELVNGYIQQFLITVSSLKNYVFLSCPGRLQILYFIKFPSNWSYNLQRWQGDLIWHHLNFSSVEDLLIILELFVVNHIKNIVLPIISFWMLLLDLETSIN